MKEKLGTKCGTSYNGKPEKDGDLASKVQEVSPLVTGNVPIADVEMEKMIILSSHTNLETSNYSHMTDCLNHSG